MTETVTKGSTKGGSGQGLTIERIYTTPGVHPYDEVTWERRDVVQQNWKTGETIFEQRGVEFPDFWSVNASTIVTTKYFRGALGTELREWSLKQLIDRVVLTYTKAGSDHGYFATAADAEIFEHELTWVLLHQVLQLQLPGLVQRRHRRAAAGQRLLHPGRRRLDGLDPELVQGGGLHLQGRLRRRPQPVPDPLVQGAARPAAARRPARSPSCAAPTRAPARSSPAARPGARPRWSCSTSTTPTSRSSSRPRPARRTRSASCATPASTWTSAAATSPRCSTRTPTTRSGSTTSSCAPSRRAREFGLRARKTGEVIETVDARELFDKIAKAAWECADPGIQYDDTINDWHTNPETGRITASNPCSEYMSLDNSSCNLAQPQPAEVPQGRRHLRRRRVRQGRRAGHHRDGHLDLLRRLPDRGDRRHHAGLPPAGHRLRQPRRAADGDRAWATTPTAAAPLAGAITSLMTGTAYKRSAELAAIVGPYDGYARNADAHQRVMRKHAAANDAIRTVTTLDKDVQRLATQAWDDVVEDRRAQRLPQRAGLGARPDRDHRLHDGLRHHRHRAGLLAGQVQEARRWRLDADRQPDDPAGAAQARATTEETVEAIVEYIAEHGHVIDAPGLQPEHYDVFDTAMGERVDRADGPRPDDGGGPAVPVRCDLQDGQPARETPRSRRSRTSTCRAGSSA